MQESPGLKLDWFDQISPFSVKNLNISLNINGSRVFLQIGSNDTGRQFFNIFPAFLWVGTMSPFFHSNEKAPVLIHC